jgi:hypothetical protein
VYRRDAPELRSARIERTQPDQIRQVEFILLRIRQLCPVDIQADVDQLLRSTPVGNLHLAGANQFSDLRNPLAAPAHNEAAAQFV